MLTCVAAGSSPDKLGRFGVLLLKLHSLRRGEQAEVQDEAVSWPIWMKPYFHLRKKLAHKPVHNEKCAKMNRSKTWTLNKRVAKNVF